MGMQGNMGNMQQGMGMANNMGNMQQGMGGTTMGMPNNIYQNVQSVVAKTLSEHLQPHALLKQVAELEQKERQAAGKGGAPDAAAALPAASASNPGAVNVTA